MSIGPPTSIAPPETVTPDVFPLLPSLKLDGVPLSVRLVVAKVEVNEASAGSKTTAPEVRTAKVGLPVSVFPVTVTAPSEGVFAASAPML
jgi:hypothetical protein